MVCNRTLSRNLLAALAAFALCSAPLAAQSAWLAPGPRPAASAELFRAGFVEDDDFSAATAAFLAGRLPLGRARLTFEVPLAYAATPTGGSTAVGNPYVGLETPVAEGRGVLELGLRLPLGGESGAGTLATGVGRFSDMDRLEAFEADVLSLALLGSLERGEGAVRLLLRGGPVFWVRTKRQRRLQDRGEMIAAYSARALIERGAASFSAGFSGRWAVTADSGGFGQNSFHQFGVTADYQAGPIRPGLLLRLPIDDDLRDVLDYVFGLRLAVRVP